MDDKRRENGNHENDPGEDRLLEAVAGVVRADEAEDRRRFDDRLRRLSAGTLPEVERAAFLAEAEGSEEARLDYETFRPLGDDFRARVLGELQERTGGSGDEPAAGAPEPAAVVPIDRRRVPVPRSWLAVAAALVLVVAGFWLGRVLRGPAVGGFELPSYLAELEGAIQTFRSPDADPGGVPAFAVGGRFRLLLRPEREVATDPDFTFFLAGAGGELRPWDVGYRMSPDGSIEIEGTLGDDLEISPDRFTLVFLYGRPGALPEPATLAELDELEAGADEWRTVRIPFRVVPGDAAGGDLPLEVRYAGCYAVSPGPVCVPYSELTFWTRSTPGVRITVRVGGRPADAEGVAVDGGLRFVVPVSIDDGAVEVVAASAGRESRFRLALAANGEPGWFREARRLAYDGEVASARERLEARFEGAPPELRGSVASLLARLGGPEAERVAWLEEAVALHRRSGRLLELADDLGMLHDVDVRHRRFTRLRQRLDAVAGELEERLPELPGEAAFHFAYYRGILENDVGNYRAALDALGDAADLARRLDLEKERALAESKMAVVLQRLGRGAEAVERFRRLDDGGYLAALSPCLQAEIHNNHAWILILAGGELGDPLPLLDRASRLAGEAGCNDPPRLDLALNRALALEQRGRGWEARQALADAGPPGADATTLHRLWWQEIEGRLALAAGHAADALDRYRRVEALADSAFEPQAQWRAKVEQAAAHQLLGDPDRALAAFAEAEALLDDQSLQVPLAAGRDRFVADREAGTRRYLELLLDSGEVERALEVARRSRSRLLRTVRRGHRLAHLSPADQAVWDHEIARYLELRAEIEADAAEDWRLSEARRAAAADRRAELRASARRALDRAFRVFGREVVNASLPPLVPGELLLAYHPLPEGWVGFAARPGGVELHRFHFDPLLLDDPGELARCLLEPFRAAVAGSSRVRVLAYGDLREVDFHALPWDGDVLLASRPVVYGLDLAPPPTAALGTAPRSRPPRRALVVGDPRGDLPAAHREAGAVEAALRRSDAFTEVARLDGADATLPELRRRLPGVDLLHVAGHGVAAGRFGWGSALLLAGDARLTLGDVLALERAPSRVVLSSCESASDAAAPTLGLGLAQAFLVAGAERVVAALRPVGDRDTEALFRRLYDRAEDPAADLAERLRRAQLAWRAEDPAADWASFRVLEP